MPTVVARTGLLTVHGKIFGFHRALNSSKTQCTMNNNPSRGVHCVLVDKKLVLMLWYRWSSFLTVDFQTL